MNIKNKLKCEKKGFTLIELIAVLAIMALLMVTFVPRVSGYIEEAKRVKALEQVRQVVLAVDSYNIRSKQPIEKKKSYSDFKEEVFKYAKDKDLINDKSISNIPDTMTYGDMKELLQQSKEFSLDENGMIVIKKE